MVEGRPVYQSNWQRPPDCMRDFLSNRKAKVQSNGDRGRQVPLLQGLPQGSVLSPPLFLLYIEDLRRVIPENVEMAIFTDGFSLFSSNPNKAFAEPAIQEAITNMAE